MALAILTRRHKPRIYVIVDAMPQSGKDFDQQNGVYKPHYLLGLGIARTGLPRGEHAGGESRSKRQHACQLREIDSKPLNHDLLTASSNQVYP